MKHRWTLFVAVAAVALAAPPLFAQGAVKDSGAESLRIQQADAQSRETAKKGELADAIVNARQVAANRDLGAPLRDSLKQSLLSLSVEKLEAFLNAGGLGDIEAAVREGMVTNALGDSAADLVFTPVPPCRVVDTRTAAAGVIVAGVSRDFKVRNAGGFASQGGNPTDCGIPLTATAVEINYVAVSAVGAGDIRAYAFGGALPNASALNYSSVPGAPFLNIANGLAQPVCNPATTTCTNDLTVLAEASNTHLVIDVDGYYNKVNKAPVRSFSVFATSTTTVAVTTTCGNFGGMQVAVVAPVAGTVAVTAEAFFLVNHTVGTTDEVQGFVDTTATTCPYLSGFTPFSDVVSVLPTSASYFQPVSVLSTFPVGAGTTTFFFNSLRSGGTASFHTGRMIATFSPN